MLIQVALCLLLKLALHTEAEPRVAPKWGTYRPHALVSVRARVPHSPIFGFVYHPLNKPEFRHLAADRPDGIRSFSWKRHDGSDAEQCIEDAELNLKITTFFVRDPKSDAWVIRFSAQSLEPGRSARPISVVFYAAAGAETQKAARKHTTNFEVTNSASRDDTKAVTIDGQDTAVGKFRLQILEPVLGALDSISSAKASGGTDASRTLLRSRVDAKLKSFSNLNRFFTSGMRERPHGAWKIEDHLTRTYIRNLQNNDISEYEGDASKTNEDGVQTRSTYNENLLRLDDEHDDRASTVLVQRILAVPCTIDATFFNTEDLSDSELDSLRKRLSSDAVSELIAEQQRNFDERFESVFKLSQRGIPEKEIQFAKVALSNVLGGIGFFHGSSVADSSSSEKHSGKEIEHLSPVSLLTATPSRSSFPRGFLWDEGFHQLIVQRWDEGLSEDCIRSWLTVMQESGWIPREQILGIEAQMRFPDHIKHLLIQKPDIANPPTLLLPLRVLAALKMSAGSTSTGVANANSSSNDVCTATSTCTSGDDVADASCQADGRCSSKISNSGASSHPPTATSKESIAFLSLATKKFAVYFDWLREAQAGNEEDTFRWRGRSLEAVTQNGYLLTLASGIDDYPRCDDPNDNERHVDLHAWMTWAAGALAEMTRAIGEDASRFEELHERWQLKFREKYLHTPSTLSRGVNSRNVPLLCDHDGDRSVCHEGYITILPFALGLLDPNDELVGTSLDAIENEDILWSPAGVRSLSASDSAYGKGDNYWTGPVWMPFNFLTLAALRTKYARVDGPYRERSEKLFVRLRETVLSNAFKVYKETGFLWENYSPEDGSGRSGRQFTGWSALVLLIYADMYQGVIL